MPQPPESQQQHLHPKQQQQQQHQQQQQVTSSQAIAPVLQSAQTQEQQQQASPSSVNHSSEGRKISCEDIQLVQNLIERCLQLYMNQAEVINSLLNQAKIEPGFTSLVWQKLEEQNPDFFKAYYTRLKLKKHIMTFNSLLEQQVHLMQKLRIIPTKPPMQQHLPNGIAMGQVPMGYPVPQLPNISVAGHPHMASMPVLPHSPGVLSGGPSQPETFHHESPVSDGMDGISPMLQCSASSGIMSDMGLGGSGMSNNVSFPFGSIGNPTDMLGMQTSMSLDVTFPSHGSDNHSQNGIVGLSISGGDDDPNNCRESLGALGHIPRNFSLSDLTAELGANSDLGALGNYSSPFMSPETETFLQSPDKDNFDNDKILDDLDFGDLK